jgi:DNA modification methylase
MEVNKIYVGEALDVLKILSSGSVNCVITSPPYYGLRDYGVSGQLGLEPTFQEYIDRLCNIFDEVKRVLTKDGTCWVNMGDTYGGTGDKGDWQDPKWKGRNGQSKAVNRTDPNKCLLQIPSRFAIEMCDRGWILRNEIIWYKPNCMPSSAKDRFTVDFEKVFFFSKNKKYWFQKQLEQRKTYENRPDAIVRDREYDYNSKQNQLRNSKRLSIKQRESSIVSGGIENSTLGVPATNGRNKRTVWRINTKPYKEAHFAVFPPELVKTPIKAGCPPYGVVLDPFMGSGTTCLMARQLGRKYVGIELNPEYVKLAKKRLVQEKLL